MKFKVAIIDDIESNRLILEKRLEQSGFDVCSAADGEAGVHLVRKERPDLILMDLKMPKISGWHAVRIIKKRSENLQIPIVAMSAHITSKDRQMMKRVGFMDYVEKPIKAAEMVKRVKSWLFPATDMSDLQEEHI